MFVNSETCLTFLTEEGGLGECPCEGLGEWPFIGGIFLVEGGLGSWKTPFELALLDEDSPLLLESFSYDFLDCLFGEPLFPRKRLVIFSIRF